MFQPPVTMEFDDGTRGRVVKITSELRKGTRFCWFSDGCSNEGE
jgi:hypothetical protein